MIKIKINSKKLNELERNTPQYYEASRTTASEKVMLNKFYDGKKRLIKEVRIGIPSKIKNSSDSSEFGSKFFKTYINNIMSYSEFNDPLPVNRFDPDIQPEEYQRRQEKIQYIIDRRNSLKDLNFVKLIQKIINNVKVGFGVLNLMNSDGSYKKEYVEKVTDRMINFISGVIGLYVDSGLIVDLQDKFIISKQEKVPNPKSPTGFSSAPKYNLIKFMNLHREASLELETLSRSLLDEINAGKKPSDKKTFSGFHNDIFEYLSKNNIELPKKVREFQEVYKKITGTPITDKYELGSLFVLYGNTDYTKSQQIDVCINLLDRFGFQLISKKRPSIYTMVFTRVPLEIVRMADFPHMESCHSVGGEYASCATQEAISEGGSVVYLFNGKFDEQMIKQFEEEDTEQLEDPDRSVSGMIPRSRIRIRTYRIVYPNADKKFTISVPTDSVYGDPSSEFYELAKQFCLTKQRDDIEQIIKINASAYERPDIDLMGGGYFEGGTVEGLLEDFLGIKLDGYVEQEYPENFEDPNEGESSIDEYEVANDWENYLNNLAIKRKNIGKTFNFSISVDVDESRSRDSDGYSSGKSVPDPSEYQVNVTVYVEMYIEMSNLIDLMASKLQQHTGISLDNIQDYLNREFAGSRQFADSKEYLDILAIVSNNNSEMGYYKDKIEWKYQSYEQYPADDRDLIKNHMNDFVKALDEVTDLSEYPKLIQSLKAEYDIGSSEISEVFKRFMGVKR